MEDLILIVVIAAILIGAAWYIYKAKKSGQKCIGCPDSGSCPHCKDGSSCCGGCGNG